ncbi:MAG: hypothetical protein R3242_10445, partial [Akkermansiaceae bacterium]|nr:hypothetical protein [Akkermansiaceae bacterium]
MKRRFHLIRAALHAWPMPKGRRGRAACPFCDTLHQGPRVKAGEAAHCIRCGHVIYENRPGSLPRATAFSLA